MNHLRELADDLRSMSEVFPTSSPEDAELFDRVARRLEEIMRGRVRADLLEGRLHTNFRNRQFPVDGDAKDVDPEEGETAVEPEDWKPCVTVRCDPEPDEETERRRDGVMSALWSKMNVAEGDERLEAERLYYGTLARSTSEIERSEAYRFVVSGRASTKTILEVIQAMRLW